jgi:hypothetical protein
MATPELKDMTFDQLVAEQAGRSLMMLGEGTRMKSIIFSAMDIALQWRAERDKITPFPELLNFIKARDARDEGTSGGFCADRLVDAEADAYSFLKARVTDPAENQIDLMVVSRKFQS